MRNYARVPMYAIRVHCADGREFYALASQSICALFWRRKEARAYLKELQPHLPDARLKVVKVLVTVEEPS
jgi:hypothetical protein